MKKRDHRRQRPGPAQRRRQAGMQLLRKAAAIVQDAGAYQRLLDVAAQVDAEEGIRQGLQDAEEGRVRPARKALDEFRARHGPNSLISPLGRSVTLRSFPMTVNVHEAKTQLSGLLKRVSAGEEVIIARAGKPVARLVPAQSEEFPLDFQRGRIKIAEDFDAPLPPSLLRVFRPRQRRKGGLK